MFSDFEATMCPEHGKMVELKAFSSRNDGIRYCISFKVVKQFNAFSLFEKSQRVILFMLQFHQTI